MLDLETFASRASRVYSESTLRRKLYVLRMYGEFLRSRGLKPGVESLARWMDELSRSGLSPQSIGVYARDVLSYFNIMLVDLDERKLRSLRSMIPRVSFRRAEYLTVDEVRRLIGVARYPYRLIYALAYAYARRLSEVLSARVDLKSNTVTFRLVKQRAGSEVTFSLEPWIREMVEEYVRLAGARDRLFDVTPRAVEIAFRNDCRRAGVEARGRRLRFHILRHCIHPNTRIVVPEGVLPAKLLYFRHSPVIAFDFEKGELCEAEVSGKFFHISNKLVSVWAGGRELICTPEHRVFRINMGRIEEVRVGSLKVGDYIAGVRRLIIPNRKKFFDTKLWRLLGYFTGDGNLGGTGENKYVQLTDKDLEIRAYYARLCRELGLSAIEREKRRAINVNSKALVDLIESLGLAVPSRSRRAPLEIFHATDEEIREYIAGLYDAEGLRVSKAGELPRIFSTSKDLLKDIQILLLYFGINSHLEKRIRNVTTPQGKHYEHHVIYDLVIASAEDVDRFAREIPTLKPVKRVKGIVKSVPKDVIPVSDVIMQIYLRRKEAGKKVADKKSGASLSKYIRANPSPQSLAKLLPLISDEPEAESLKRLVEMANDIIWLKVERIERSGEYSKNIATKEVKVGHYLVFDFEVPGPQTLITDGIISHNSRVTHLVEAGVQLEVVSKFLVRHSSISTTFQFYTAPTEAMAERIPRAQDVLFKGGRGGGKEAQGI